jgi:DNA-directed RNA polymerase
MKDIYDSVDNPLNGARWWLNAEDPWQCLAACMELKAALESPDPTRFVSNLPVHQDGTCNGLQHYAALGGDVWGAKQVNLEPGDRPADVYTAVADLVKESIAEDRTKGHVLATALEGKISRKTVKQTVMTNVYGVTFVGARNQVKKQLTAAHPNLQNDNIVNPLLLSSYVAQKIFRALSSMFQGAHDIQYWFGECASRVAMCLTPEQLDRIQGEWPKLLSTKKDTYKYHNSFNLEEATQFKSTVIWTTPLHMPVVQPYRSCKSRVIPTTMQSIALQEPHRSHAVSKRKQLQAFPPNFIHSLDATHMLLSALKCDDLGLTFAAVHDSFWTHASDIGTMNGVLRDAFIKIHSEDVIGRLAAEFEARYRGCIYLSHVHSKSPVGKKIVAWRKEFSSTNRDKIPTIKRAPKLDELLMERKRYTLLNSSDPAEVEEGKKMVTPASIFEEFSSESDSIQDPALKEIGLGEIPSSEATVADTDADAMSADMVTEDADETDEARENPDESEEEEEESTFERALNRKTIDTRAKKIPIWLPLTFPRMPKKVCSITKVVPLVF